MIAHSHAGASSACSTVAPSLSQLGTAAYGYAAMDWAVFRLKPRSKIPLVPKSAGGNGVHHATTDLGRIVAWWAEVEKLTIAAELRALAREARP